MRCFDRLWHVCTVHVPGRSPTFGRETVWPPAHPRPPMLQVSSIGADGLSESHQRHTNRWLLPQCSQMNGFSFLKLFCSTLSFLSFFSSLFPSIPLATCLAHPPSPPSPFLYSSLLLFSSLLHCALALCFFLISSPPSFFCHRTAVQRQISVFVPVRQKHGELHAKTQSANADKGGGIQTSVHTKHQTHLNHKMKWLTSAELENIFLPSLF